MRKTRNNKMINKIICFITGCKESLEQDVIFYNKNYLGYYPICSRCKNKMEFVMDEHYADLIKSLVKKKLSR